MVKKAAVEDISHKVFDNMLIKTMGEDEITKQVYSAYLNCYKFQQDEKVWLGYLSFLKSSGGNCKQEYERALIMLTPASGINFSKKKIIDLEEKKRTLLEGAAKIFA